MDTKEIRIKREVQKHTKASLLSFLSQSAKQKEKKSHYFIYTFISYRKYYFTVSKYQIQPIKDENLPILSVL